MAERRAKMRDYDEDQAYDEVREDFIEEFKDQLKGGGNGIYSRRNPL